MTITNVLRAICSLLLLGIPAASAAAEPATELPTATTMQPNGDKAQVRCLQTVLSGSTSDQYAWCDVQIEELNRELNRSPAQNAELAAAYQNRAVLNLRSTRFEQAEADLTEALRLRPGMYAAYLTRGNLRLTQARFAEALDDYNEAIRLSNADVPAMFVNRALALRGLGEIEAAEVDALRAAGATAAFSPSGSAALPADGSR